jgi:Rhodopirellula transposase DDE domain
VGGKTRTGADGAAAQGWDHDPPAQRKWTPLGILMMATGVLTIIFGTQETSDFWVDGLKLWWLQVKAGLPLIRRLVIYLDNGPNNSGSRTQFLKRVVEFADWSGFWTFASQRPLRLRDLRSFSACRLVSGVR